MGRKLRAPRGGHFRAPRAGFVKNIGTDFIDLLVAAEVPVQKTVVLTDISDFGHFCDFWELFGLIFK